jgi:hypothetical protein
MEEVVVAEALGEWAQGLWGSKTPAIASDLQRYGGAGGRSCCPLVLMDQAAKGFTARGPRRPSHRSGRPAGDPAAQGTRRRDQRVLPSSLLS